MKVNFFSLIAFTLLPRSSGLEGGGLLVVEVTSACLHLGSLLLLSGTCSIGNLSELALVLTVSKHLLSTKMLLLLSPHSFSVLLLLLGHLGLTELHAALVHHSTLLLIVEALEVVRLDTVGSKH